MGDIGRPDLQTPPPVSTQEQLMEEDADNLEPQLDENAAEESSEDEDEEAAPPAVAAVAAPAPAPLYDIPFDYPNELPEGLITLELPNFEYGDPALEYLEQPQQEELAMQVEEPPQQQAEPAMEEVEKTGREDAEEPSAAKRQRI